MALDKYLDELWRLYSASNPQALFLQKLIKSKNPHLKNDHIAFRTFSEPFVNLEAMAEPFLQMGYQYKDNYVFSEKKLKAKHLVGPEGAPLIFISEIQTKEFSSFFYKVFSELKPNVKLSLSLPTYKRPWLARYDVYQKLLLESEYGAWLYAWGFCPNHFTIQLNSLEGNPSIYTFNSYLKEQGLILNTSGGEVKGTPDEYLEQSATLAVEVECEFLEGMFSIPCCYYEFAKRYTMPNGKLFQGFVTKNANTIFESTDVQNKSITIEPNTE